MEIMEIGVGGGRSGILLWFEFSQTPNHIHPKTVYKVESVFVVSAENNIFLLFIVRFSFLLLSSVENRSFDFVKMWYFGRIAYGKSLFVPLPFSLQPPFLLSKLLEPDLFVNIHNHKLFEIRVHWNWLQRETLSTFMFVMQYIPYAIVFGMLTAFFSIVYQTTTNLTLRLYFCLIPLPIPLPLCFWWFYTSWLLTTGSKHFVCRSFSTISPATPFSPKPTQLQLAYGYKFVVFVWLMHWTCGRNGPS